MSLLIVGVFVWSLTHLFPAVLPGPRQNLERKLGENPYRGLFSLFIIGGLIMIVLGWKSATPSAVYAPPLASGPVSSALVLIGFVLFFASQAPGNIKRFIRHPQMTGTILWGVSHLLTNGDTRSVTLFGGLTVWAVLEIVMINRRDGQWKKPVPAAIGFDVIPMIIGAVTFAVVLYFHGSLFGASLLPI
jgi:uncharacterized membrane protein